MNGGGRLFPRVFLELALTPQSGYVKVVACIQLGANENYPEQITIILLRAVTGASQATRAPARRCLNHSLLEKAGITALQLARTSM